MSSDLSYDSLMKQELELELPYFNTETAFRLGMLLVERAKKEEKELSITVSIGRQTIFHYGAVSHGPNADHWLRRKQNAVYEYHMSSLRFGAKLKQEESCLAVEGRTDYDFTGIGGAVPIIVKGAGVIGACAVSGMPHVIDHQYVCQALKTLQGELNR